MGLWQRLVHPFAPLRERLDALERSNGTMQSSLTAMTGSMANLQTSLASVNESMTSIHESLGSIWTAYGELDARVERADAALETTRTAILEEIGALRSEVERSEAAAAQAQAAATEEIQRATASLGDTLTKTLRENMDKTQKVQARTEERSRAETKKLSTALTRVRTDLLAGQKSGLTQQAEALSKQTLETKKRLVKAEQQMKRIERLVDVAVARHGDELGQELALAAQARRRALVEVEQPLVLISQVARSGGRLLSQLFDCHPSCHVHPYELHIGHPDPKTNWPELDLSAGPAQWWEALAEPPVERYFRDGLKGGSAENPETLPFLVVPSLAREIFENLAADSPIASRRDILNAYMTAYFNAWLDNQNLHGVEKRWVVGFVPGMTTGSTSRAGFFRDYPDGRLISVVRDPRGWYASAHARTPALGAPAEAIALWRESAEAQLAAKEEYGDSVLLLRFERLLSATRATMGTVTKFLGIDLPKIALVPTFNGMPIKANSSFDVEENGVLRGPATRGKMLDSAVGEEIDRLAGDLYDRLLSITA